MVTADGQDHAADVVEADPLTGVAVVRAVPPLDGPPLTFPAATLGASPRLRVGQRAAVVGAVPGQGAGREVAVGVVSALGTQVPNGDGEPLLDMIRTDAQVQADSAGGALVDDRGLVVGIAMATAGPDGVVHREFATPIDVAREVADQILTDGKVTYVWMGVEGPTGTWPSAPAPPEGGALVQEVKPNSPAHVAQIVPGDVIVAIKDEAEEHPVASMEGLRMALRAYEPNQSVTVTVRRAGTELDKPVILAERPSS